MGSVYCTNKLSVTAHIIFFVNLLKKLIFYYFSYLNKYKVYVLMFIQDWLNNQG